MKRVISAAVLAIAAAILFAAQAAPSKATPSVTPRDRLQGPGVTAEPPEDLVQPDPHVLLGQLPNGLRYAVSQTAGPPETAIDFYIGAGSKDETEAERGTAHFLEHMAFSGSKNFPAGTVLQRFEDIGVALGRDQNAQTGLSGTTFSLVLPSSTDAKFDMAFSWLRDVADGSTIAPAEVDRERGTILSEYRESLSPSTTLARKAGEFMLPELLGSHRLPIGTLATINSATAASIRAFYEKWYRPEDAILIVVSDEPVSTVVAKIENTFGSWKDATPMPVKPDLGDVDATRGLDVMTEADPNVAGQLQVCRAMDKDPPMVEGVAFHMRDLENTIWSQVLGERFLRLSETANPPFIAAQVSRDEVFDRAALSCVSLGVRDQDWRSAVRAAAEETRRMDLYGITPEEMAATRAAIQSSLDASLAGGDKMAQKARADLMLDNFLHNGTIDSVEEDYRVVSTALSRITAERVFAEFHRVWSQSNGPLIVLVSGQPVDPAEVKKVWLAAEAEPKPAAPVDRTSHAWAYTDFGPPGVVAHRQPVDDIGADRIAFANGVRVNFKTVDNIQDKVFIRIRFGAGQEEIPVAKSFTASMGSLLLRAGGLGKNDFQDTVELCQTHSCNISLAMGRDSFVMDGETRVQDLDTELQLLTAYLTDPGFRPELDAQLPTVIGFAFRQMKVDPDTVANQALQNALPKPNPFAIPTEAEAARIKSADFARLLGPVLKTDALEVTVIGDVDEDTVVAALAKTLGAIPPRQRIDRTLPDAPRVRFPAVAPPPIHVTHAGPADKASVILSWPLFVWDPGKLHEQRTIELLGDVLQDEMIEDVRRKLGKTYSPSVRVSLGRGGDQGQLVVQLTTAPADAQAVIDETRRIVDGYAAGGITAEALERARKPLLDGGQTHDINVVWWMNVLDGSWAHPDLIAAANSWQSDYAGITLAEVQAEAKRWFSQTPIIVVASPKAAP
jgi:zinc protease